MTYDYGLVRFIQAKKLKSTECINAFLKSEGITDFTAKNHSRVNGYIKKNWTKFASFCDRGIKDGALTGRPVKLNISYDIEREYKDAVKNELETIKLTSGQQEFLAEIKQNGVGKLQSEMMKAGINPVGKDLKYKSRSLQWLPIVNQAIASGIIIKQLKQC